MVEPLLPPSRLVIATETFRTMPAVVISLAANRVWPVCESRRDTSHSAALEKERILSASAFAWSLVQLISGGPQYVDPPEPRGSAPVAHGVDLSGLALAVGVETDVFPESLAADAVAGGPEVRRAALVGDVGDHAADLSALDLPERVAAELEVVALLVDRIRAAAVDQDAVLDARPPGRRA